ncbi:serine hydrolase domain-containing protein [Hymenobacter negativus]|uniref:Beta-lactamase family protein n=1 Tax=Hymenobacter negativus TaxID=2795026 RepID=A0ABS3QL38_9BACT|nr:serine hydrolase domain-containing protein [Hymenobacter negativus]MBO2011395.1 beta-lactamase family protein [Hymenobacter negativus]
MHSRLSLLLLVWLFSNFPASAQLRHSSVKLPTLLAEIKKVMQQEHMPGLMLSVVAGDSIIFSGGLGVANVKTGQKIDGKTLFHLNSITKMFIALGILKLVAEHKLHLEDKLSDIAPEVKYQNPWESSHPVRVIHLLEHSTGFDDVHLNMVCNATSTDLTGVAAVQFYQTCLVARWQPGLASSYASPNYTILGYIIEKSTRMPWSQYLQQALLGPLGMRYSDFDLRIKGDQRYARGYRLANGAYIPFPFFVPTGNGAPGALHSCADDMSCYLRFFLNNWKIDGQPWVDSSYLTTMETIHSTAAAKGGLQMGYALGNLTFFHHAKADFRGHAGLGDGFASLINYDRRRRVGYAISNNSGQGMWRVSELIEDFLTQELPPITPATARQVPLSMLEAYQGYYKPVNVWNEQWDFLQRITGGLHVTQYQGKLILKPLFGRADTVSWFAEGLFRQAKKHHASVVLGKLEDGTSFLQAHNTHQLYKKTAYWPVLLQQLGLGLSVLAMGLSLLWALVWSLLAVFNSAIRQRLLVGLLPGLAVCSGLMALRVMTITDSENKIAFNSINPTSLAIFFASLFFGVFAMAGVMLLVRQWSQLSPAWARGVMAFNALFLNCLVVLLWAHGWVGLRTWAL